MEELSTTAYAILGLLALRPWSTYELAQQVKVSLNFFWPRTERQLYEQPKALVAAGLARATREDVGRRPRTVYRITAKGRRALAAWLAQPGGPPTLEWEGMVKVFFAENGDKDDLLAHLRQIQEWRHNATAESRAFRRRRLEDFPFPERLHLSSLVNRFFVEYAAAIERWADWAVAEVETWPDVNGPVDVDRLVDESF
jgi:PadR family transcriptional regulator, regulatory protein AphA